MSQSQSKTKVLDFNLSSPCYLLTTQKTEVCLHAAISTGNRTFFPTGDRYFHLYHCDHWVCMYSMTQRQSQRQFKTHRSEKLVRVQPSHWFQCGFWQDICKYECKYFCWTAVRQSAAVGARSSALRNQWAAT